LLSALIGLVIGGAIFLIGRSFVDRIVIFGASVFPADVRPSAALAALIAVAVPAAAVGVTVASLRRVVVEPLGVARRSGDVKRRVWWRLLLPVVGVALLVPYFGRLSKSGGSFSTGVVVLAVGLILVGVATLLPWVVQATVRRARGGPVSWQLAVRRLQLEGASSARAVTGIAVAVAGAIGLQMLFGGVRGGYVTNTDVTGVVAEASLPLRQGVDGIDALRAIITATPGVTAVDATVRLDGHAGNDQVAIYVGDCATLGRLATLPSCRDGDVFQSYVDNAADTVPVAGQAVRIDTDQPVDWIVPDTARAVPNRASAAGLLVTPGALPAAVRDNRALYLTARVRLDEADPDALDRLRNTVWTIDPTSYVNQIAKHVESDRLAQIRLGLYVGAVVTLLLIGASLLVTVLEQLRDRRRLLATLTAFGTRRRTIAWSIMWQTTIPVVLGVAVAVAAGIGLGAALQRMASAPLSIHWSVVGVMSGIAAAVVLLVTALSLPALFRLMRPEGLRAE
jgi:predicted lysophospholipase L1 biosynthesis ABC-type transport system permease subunit